MWRAGVFQKFWFWTVEYAHQYGTIMTVRDGISTMLITFPRVATPAASLWILAALGLTTFWWYPPARRYAVFCLGWMAFSVLALSVGMYFREHYYILLLPALSVSVGVLVVSAMALLRQWKEASAVPAIPLALLAGAMAWTVWIQRDMFFEKTPVEFSRALYFYNPFPEAVPIADFVRQHSRPEDRIAVLGSEPEIYFYAHRRSATGYLYTYALMEPQPYARTMQDDLIAEVESVDPPMVVVVNIQPSWTAYPISDPHILQWLNTYVHQRYHMVGVADLLGPSHTEYVWGDAAANYQVKSKFVVYVFQKNAPATASNSNARSADPAFRTRQVE
jgi:hypothetical protein